MGGNGRGSKRGPRVVLGLPVLEVMRPSSGRLNACHRVRRSNTTLRCRRLKLVYPLGVRSRDLENPVVVVSTVRMVGDVQTGRRFRMP